MNSRTRIKLPVIQQLSIVPIINVAYFEHRIPLDNLTHTVSDTAFTTHLFQNIPWDVNSLIAEGERSNKICLGQGVIEVQQAN